jgi:hypothetical protein
MRFSSITYGRQEAHNVGTVLCAHIKSSKKLVYFAGVVSSGKERVLLLYLESAPRLQSERRNGAVPLSDAMLAVSIVGFLEEKREDFEEFLREKYESESKSPLVVRP